MLVLGLATALLVFTLWTAVAMARPPSNPVGQGWGPDDRRPDVVLLGDSLTHGRIGADWSGLLRAWHPELAFYNAGKNGDLVWALRQRLTKLRSHPPPLVVVLVGTNDVLAAANPEMATRYQRGFRLPSPPTFTWSKEQFRELVAELRGLSERVILCTIPPIGNGHGRTAELARVWNETVREQAVPSELVDLHAALVTSSRQLGPSQHDASFVKVVCGMFWSALQHYGFGRTWNAVGRSYGSDVLCDGIHLNDTAARELASLVSECLVRVPVAGRP